VFCIKTIPFSSAAGVVRDGEGEGEKEPAMLPVTTKWLGEVSAVAEESPPSTAVIVMRDRACTGETMFDSLV
jgi:hypothetical protein